MAIGRSGTRADTPPARPFARRAGPWLLAGLLAALAAGAWYASTGNRAPPANPAPAVAGPADDAAGAEARYVGSASCAACHADEHARWQSSQHAVAMQLATGETVLGDFSGVRAKHAGVTSEFFRRDDRYVVRTDGPDGQLAEFEVRYTFGVYPLQQYLVELPRGHLQALPYAWDVRTKAAGGQRWFHLYPGERIDHEDELHWTRRQQNWNFMCADCHSTAVRKNYDAATDTYATTYEEISVGCESCHGPGGRHVALAEAAAASGATLEDHGLAVTFDERRGAGWVIDPATGNAVRTPPRATEKELDVCGQCHARRSQYSDDYRPGDPLLDHYRGSILSAGLYHPDGQQRDEVFNWGSFLSSRMYAKGVTCSDCHDPHDGKLRAPGNATCAQCHDAAKYDSTEHHFHPAGTAGAACAACHMKPETYMVIDGRHDHSFRIPRPDLTVALGVPNACNACHSDRKAEWAAAEVRKRYPDPKPGFQGFAEAFAAADRGDPSSAIALAQVAANLDESAIARASAIERLARAPGETTMLAAEAGLDDASPLVRQAAAAAYGAMPPQQRQAVIPLLADPVRAVRMQAARTLAPLADDAVGAEHVAALRAAGAEYVAAERFNADRPESRVNLGGYYADRGETAAAEAEYQAALKLDPRFGPAWANLADLRRLQGRETDAEAALRQGIEQVPGVAALHHSLGLALVRQQRYAEALVELERAVQLEPGNARYAYVYEVARRDLAQR